MSNFTFTKLISTTYSSHRIPVPALVFFPQKSVWGPTAMECYVTLFLGFTIGICVGWGFLPLLSYWTSLSLAGKDRGSSADNVSGNLAYLWAAVTGAYDPAVGSGDRPPLGASQKKTGSLFIIENVADQHPQYQDNPVQR
jgi:hypothetical protein